MNHGSLQINPRQHLCKTRICPTCGREIRGNAFFTHRAACAKKQIELAPGPSPINPSAPAKSTRGAYKRRPLK